MASEQRSVTTGEPASERVLVSASEQESMLTLLSVFVLLLLLVLSPGIVRERMVLFERMKYDP